MPAIDIIDSRLKAFKPGSPGSTFVTIDAIESVELTESGGDPIDRGSVAIENTDGKLTGTNRITSGDGVIFELRREGESSLSRRFVGMARDVSDSFEGGGRRTTEIELTDFVFSTLSFRTADAAFENTAVGDIVDTLVAAEAPIIDRSRIAATQSTTDINIQGRTLNDVITQELAPAGDAILGSDLLNVGLIFQPLQNVSDFTTLTPTDIHSPFTVERIDDELINSVRVDGGTDHKVDDEQLNQSSTTRVTDTNRVTQAVETRKSEISRVQLFTQRDPNSNDGLTVRIQAGRNGSPVAINDRESDIANRTLADDFLATNGFTEFQMPDHSLAADSQPFIIVESDGTTGQPVGTDANGALTFKVLFPFPLLARAENAASVNEFRRRELRVSDESLETEAAVQRKAQSRLRHRAEPKRRISGQAVTRKAHALRPPDAVKLVGFGADDVGGNFIVTERRTSFNGRQLTTELTFEDATTL